jgi:hypothetical protein
MKKSLLFTAFEKENSRTETFFEIDETLLDAVAGGLAPVKCASEEYQLTMTCSAGDGCSGASIDCA